MDIRKRVFASILAFISLAVPSLAQGPGPHRIADLAEPQISTKPNTKAIVVEAKGDPNIVGGKAFGLLFQLYYGLKETPKGLLQPAPRARWLVWEGAPRAEWVGRYSLPVPDSVAALPPFKVSEGLTASLTAWEYGDVAEILHVGPYDREEPTIQRLRDYVSQHGFTIVGPHEEEYVKGPTMRDKGDPNTYLTIIRYRVQRPSSREYIEIFK